MATSSESEQRLNRFVDWIRPPDETTAKIREQVAEIRERIVAKAREDGLVVRSTPNSGSFAKRTGLRRHWNPAGGSPIAGQDVDLAFVVSPKTEDGEQLERLLDRFDRYAKASYPATKRSRTRSSIQLDFVKKSLRYDVVPLLATEKDDEQILVRADGERRRTSIQKHIDFVRRRNHASTLIEGTVRFNDCVRLLKWLRDIRAAQDDLLREVPTVVIELLAAKAFDRKRVDATYMATLPTWFDELARIVRRREGVVFQDYHPGASPPPSQRWQILDPTNLANDVLPKPWGARQFNRLATWFEDSATRIRAAVQAENRRDPNNAVHELTALFGAPFRQASEAKQ